MTEKEKMRLWAVEEMAELSSEMKLVKNIYTGQLLLRRIYPPDSLGILRRLSRIHSPNLMAIYDAEIIGNVCVALCEFISGITLEESVRQRGLYNEYAAAKIAAEICAGLSALHSAGIIHRDINPSNVMLDQSGCVKIIDYDIARIAKPEKTQDTTVLGTVGYAAPEQFGFRQTDPRADIYSCGVVLNFLLTGKTPQEQPYRGRLRLIISRCVSLDPNERYKSAAHLHAVLTDDRRTLKLLDKNDFESMRFRPLPGFRSRHVLPKIITGFFITIYTFALILHIATLIVFPVHGFSVKTFLGHVFYITILYGCWTLFPYLLFGDIGRYSLYFSPDLRTRRRLNKLFGWLSIILGIVLFFVMVGLSSKNLIEL